MKFKIVGTALVTLALAVTLAGQDVAREQKLQQAIDLLETKGDVARAMPLLEEVAKSADQSLAARGLLYLGQAQERQGKDQARRTYERIIRDFATQTQVVAQARSRLAGMATTSAVPSTAVSHRLLQTLPAGAWSVGKVSADGRYVPYSTGDDLLVHDLATGAARVVVPGTAEGYAEDASFSRDSKQLAYSWYSEATNGCELRVVQIAATGTGQARSIVDDPTLSWVMPFDWTTDGKYIAVEIERRDGTEEIAIVTVADGSRRTLKRASLWMHSMAFSPDGRFLAVDDRASEASANDIYALPLDGSTEIPVVTHRADDLLVGWTPDGGRILFTSDRGGTRSLWAQGFVNGAPKGGPALVKDEFGQTSYHSVGSNGAVHSVSGSAAGGMDIRTGSLNMLTGEWTAPVRDVVQEYSIGINRSPEWSPDGKSLAYLTRGLAARGDWAVAIRAVGASHATEIRTRLPFANDLRWFPDGRTLLVFGQDRDSRLGWWRVDSTTSETTPFELNQPGGRTAILRWSPDGSKLYLNRWLSARELAVVERDLTSNVERELFRGPRGSTAGPQGDADPNVSPDGRKLYYRKVLPGESKSPFTLLAFIERDLTSGAEREIARGNPLGWPQPSPDGQYIATARNNPSTKTRAIVVIPAAGDEPREVLRVPLSADFVAGRDTTNHAAPMAWAGDSRSLLARTTSGKDKPVQLWWVPIDGRTAPKVIVEEWRGGPIRLHPDGRQLVFHVTLPAARQPQQIWVLENAIK